MAKKTALTEDRIARVPGDLVLGGIADEALGVGEGDAGWGGLVALLAGDDHDAAVLPEAHAGVRRPQVDPDGRTIVVVLAGHHLTSTTTTFPRDHQGEGSQLQFPPDVFLHLAQLPGHVVGRPETTEEGGVLLLAVELVDELEGLLHTLRQILQWAAHGRVLHCRLRRRRVIKPLQENADSRRAPRDLAALPLVLPDRLHGLLDLERDLHDLPRHADEFDTVVHLAWLALCGVQSSPR